MSDHRVAPAWRRILVVAVLAVLALAFVGRAGAATGDTLRTISADQSGTACVGGGIGVGLAFNGTNLLVSCYFDSTVVAVSPANGAQMIGGVHVIAGASSLGALAWDSGRNVLWACSGFSTIGTIDLSTNVFTAAFGSADCFDGLAYDASDDTLWASPDASMPINHYSVTGTLLGSFTTSLGGYGNSGIAVGGALLYLANNGGSQIYTSDKAFSLPPVLFASFPARIEDLECDNVTFAPLGAMWSKDAYDTTLNAFEIPAGSCSFGGGGGHVNQADLSVTKTDNVDPAYVGDNVTYTITVTNNGPDAATNVTVTDSLPGAGATFVSASAGCSVSLGTVTCLIGGLASGASATVTVMVNATAAGTLIDKASASGSEADPNGANNSAIETTVVLPRDRVAPVLGCTATTNPAGKVIPPAGTNPRSGQNPDGFYLLSGSDNVDATVSIFIVDRVSGAVFGPFAPGTKIKLVQAPGATPGIKPGAGVINWMVTLKGDAIIRATDAAGNTGTASCRVPPPPK